MDNIYIYIYIYMARKESINNKGNITSTGSDCYSFKFNFYIKNFFLAGILEKTFLI